MHDPYFVSETLDDVLRSVIEAIEKRGDRINATQGENLELTGVLLEVADPRARLSRTETRGKPFSCLGELCWYLAGSNQLDTISYYLPHYRKFAEGNSIFGAYGPRLFGCGEADQVKNIIGLLKRKQSSRQAVIQLFAAGDIVEEHKDVPCTCALQFMVRGDALQLITYMRSNDVYLGLPHDVFSFTMLQEIVARALSLEVGTYKHAVGSIHLYERDRTSAQQFLDEGWQSTTMSMPAMPEGDPWPAVEALLNAEATVREGDELSTTTLDELESYWADLVRLLQVFRYSKDKDADKIIEVKGRMSSDIYNPFIDKKLHNLL